MSILSRIIVNLVLMFLPMQVLAASDDWIVAKATSQVKYTIDRQTWADLHAGETVPNRAWISTGPRGRAQLTRGVESIGFQPNTLASITTTSGLFSSRKTEIVQQVGSLDLEIEKRSQPHTTVQTPYLAAVVKGTIFHVIVSKTNASVSVDRGLVQVTSFASGQQSSVGPRQRATVDKKSGMTVAGAAAKPSIKVVSTSVAKIPALGSTTLSGQTHVGTDETNGSVSSLGNTGHDVSTSDNGYKSSSTDSGFGSGDRTVGKVGADTGSGNEGFGNESGSKGVAVSDNFGNGGGKGNNGSGGGNSSTAGDTGNGKDNIGDGNGGNNDGSNKGSSDDAGNADKGKDGDNNGDAGNTGNGKGNNGNGNGNGGNNGNSGDTGNGKGNNGNGGSNSNSGDTGNGKGNNGNGNGNGGSNGGSTNGNSEDNGSGKGKGKDK